MKLIPRTGWAHRAAILIAAWLFFSGLATFTSAELSAQEITRVAVLDYNKVLKEYPRQSRELQRINDLKQEVQGEMKKLQQQLQQLQEELSQAQDKDRNAQVRRIQDEISKQRDYGRKYLESKNEEIKTLQDKAMSYSHNGNIQQVLPDIISQVAREQGYSLILDKNNQGIIWLDISIDITETVVQRLKARLEEGQ